MLSDIVDLVLEHGRLDILGFCDLMVDILHDSLGGEMCLVLKNCGRGQNGFRAFDNLWDQFGSGHHHSFLLGDHLRYHSLHCLGLDLVLVDGSFARLCDDLVDGPRLCLGLWDVVGNLDSPVLVSFMDVAVRVFVAFSLFDGHRNRGHRGNGNNCGACTGSQSAASLGDSSAPVRAAGGAAATASCHHASCSAWAHCCSRAVHWRGVYCW